MRLTRLEAKGFKSFGDKIILHFGAGVTGVVGPNGCGKSNVVDAIRWVLGEQRSRALRSASMESVIFNGTAQRKPQQLAEVSLTFENDRGVLPAEYTTVSITRRYYRTGESEYQINGQTCRLRDIDNLFADTGIGPDSYAIIELKMVDDILNDRDGSRRGLFEEAAGISKYKQRRKETGRRLDDVQADLERVDDLLHEITRNLRGLERQAKAAERYFELKEKHRSIGLNAAKREYDRRRADVERLRGQSEGLARERVQLTGTIAASEQGLTSYKEEVEKASRLVGDRQQTFLRMQEQVRKIETDRRVYSERRRSEDERLRQLSTQLEADTKRHEEVTQNLTRLAETEAKLTKEAAGANATKTGAGETLATLQSALQTAQTEVQAAERQHRQTEEALRGLQREDEIGKAQAATYAQEQARLEERSAQHTSSMAGFDEKIGSLAATLAEAQATLAKLQTDEEHRQAREGAAQAKLEDIREQLTAVTRKRDAAQNEYNLTKSLQDNLEGYPEAIRYLRKHREWAASPQTPLVSDLFACPEQYRIALEYYLEAVLNYYVVETEAEAERAIHILAGAGKGKASFFVLSRFAAQGKEWEQVDFPPDSTPVMQVIECDPRYRLLVSFLLGRACFMDKPTAAEDDRVDVLAMDGHQIIRATGRQGGSVGLYEGKRIGRAKNLEKLAIELSTMAKQIGELETVQTQTRAILEEARTKNLRTELDRRRRELSQLEQDQAAWRIRREQAAATLQDQAGRMDALKQTLASLEEAALARAPKQATLLDELTAGQQKLAAARAAQQQHAQALDAHRDHARQAELEAQRITGLLGQAARERMLYTDENTRLTARIVQATKELEATQARSAALAQTDTIGDDELQAMHKELADVEAGVKDAQRAAGQARHALEQADAGTRELARRREQNQTLLSELSIQLSGMEARLEGLAERILADFDLPINQVEADPALTDVPEADLTRQAQELKAQLDKLGPINPVAMESYKEMADRNAFIDGQKQDLVNARTSLETTIAEIETEAQRAFLATYEAVRANFHKVFRSLFTDEDTCDLVLAKPDQPLESPIDIMARPKGKRPLSINQLSGGEKTLTAIALLFAIYLIKPAPFCIFDEVDAPLDDANIDKFNNIIRDFSSNSQFIVVTHNKRTMTHADILYGITMVEQGVSRVIPVDLRQMEKVG